MIYYTAIRSQDEWFEIFSLQYWTIWQLFYFRQADEYFEHNTPCNDLIGKQQQQQNTHTHTHARTHARTRARTHARTHTIKNVQSRL